MFGDRFAPSPSADWMPVDEALARLRNILRPVGGREAVPSEKAVGRVLWAPVIARRSNPPADNAAVDGYAFTFADVDADTADLAKLPLASGRSAAGHPFGSPLPAGCACRIFTGAELPEGADTIVLQEDCEVSSGYIRFSLPKKSGANVRRAAEDVKAGAEILPAGRRLSAQDIAFAAAVGIREVEAYSRPRLAVVSTGDELIVPGVDGCGTYDANRPMLRALGAAMGAEVVDLGIVRDNEADARAAFDQAAREADAVIATGGVSGGDEDHISRLLKAEGGLIGWRIAIKPGRPLALGTWRGLPVFGLPGNPVAAFVCALIFVRPALSLLGGGEWAEPQSFTVPAAFRKSKKPGRREYLRARIRDGRAEVFHSEGSGLVGGLSWADGLVELPHGAMEIGPGDPVRYMPFSGFGL